MISVESLIAQIKESFKDAKFPSHLGLHAALAVDEWIEDKNELQGITKEKDFNGNWWDVPNEHLLYCGSLGLNYLDSIGMYFYIPAFMLSAIREGEPKALLELLVAMDPSPFKDDDDLQQLFYEQYKLFDSEKKQLCLHFFQFMKTVYVDPIRYYGLNDRLDEILQDEFWSQNNSNQLG